jgi:hypothetical protein
MPAAIDMQVKKKVINQWLSADSRDEEIEHKRAILESTKM